MKYLISRKLDIEALRRCNGWTATHVAEISGIHRNTIARIEAGETPSLANAMALAHLFGYRVEDIWTLSA